MTYAEIVKQALAHLEYGTDDDAVSTFGERFIIYANDAARKIAMSLRTNKVETVTLDNGHFSTDDLTGDVTKIVEVYKDKRAYPFVQGDELGDFKVIGCDPGETVSVRYRYIPSYEGNAEAQPDIPAIFHPILYLYVVHCHNNTRSTSTDYDRTKWLREFESERKRIMKQAYGSLDTYAWKNEPWETGEM